MSDSGPWLPSPSARPGAKLQLSQKLIIEALVTKLCKIGNENVTNAGKKLRSSSELQADLLRHPENIVLLLAAIKRGASIDIMEPYVRSVRDGRNLLHHAAQRHNAALLRQLLPAGELVNKPDNEGHTPLALSILCSSWECVQILIEAGAFLGRPTQLNGSSLLFRVVSTLNIDVMLLPKLLHAGAKTNIRDGAGRTLLMIATTTTPVFRSEEAMTHLLQAGGNIHAQDHAGLTALHHLLSPTLLTDDTSLMRRLSMLLRALPDVNAVTREGNTPLHIMCGSNRQWPRNAVTSVWMALMREGANPGLLNDAGKSPCDHWQQVHRSAPPWLPPNTLKIP